MLDGTAERGAAGRAARRVRARRREPATARPRADRHRLRGAGLRRGRASSSRRAGLAVRVVSMPSWDLFEAAARRLPRRRCCRPTCPTLAVEAGVSLRLGALRRRRRQHRPLRRVGAGRRRAARARHHARARRRARARAARRDRTGGELIMASRHRPADRVRPEPLVRQPHPRARHRRACAISSTTHGIRGVTSNPTIFEKAMASGTDYDAQLREVVGRRRVDRRRVLGPRHHRHRATPPTSCARTTTSSTAPTASCRSRSSPDLAHDTDGDDRAGQGAVDAARPART